MIAETSASSAGDRMYVKFQQMWFAPVDYSRCEVQQQRRLGCRPWTAWQVECEDGRAGWTQSAPTWQTGDAVERTKITNNKCNTIQTLSTQPGFYLHKEVMFYREIRPQFLLLTLLTQPEYDNCSVVTDSESATESADSSESVRVRIRESFAVSYTHLTLTTILRV